MRISFDKLLHLLNKEKNTQKEQKPTVL